MDAAQVVERTSARPSAGTTSNALEIIQRTVVWSSRSSWLWPRGEHGLSVGFSAIDDLSQVMPLCGRKRVCVQAGGAAGIYPLYLANHFDHVYTWEPNPWLFQCLTGNADLPTVHKFEAALGLGQEMVHMQCPHGQETNQGAWHTDPGGYIPEMRVDDLWLPDVDFICLDIEGSEPDALAGANRTIERCRPVIMLEDKRKIREAHGIPEDWLDAICATLDYHVHHRSGPDVVLVPR